MKAILVILFFMSTISFASTKLEMSNSETADNLKWLKLGYEVAKHHAPDYEIASHIVAETCSEEVETWDPKTLYGESYQDAPSSFNVVYYYEGKTLMPVYYRCKDGQNGNVGRSRQEG